MLSSAGCAGLLSVLLVPGAIDQPITDITELSLEDLLRGATVTASKREQPIDEAPAIVTVFTRRDLDSLGVKRLIDVLRLTPGFVEVSAPMERNVASRGVHASTAQDIVVLVDGLRMNDFLTNTAMPDSFLLDMAERVEIIRGPGAALYGANALTGVVNIISRTADKAPSLEGALAYGTNDSAQLDVRHAHAADDGTRVFLSGSYLQSRGTRVAIGGSEDVLIDRVGQKTSDGTQQGENLTRPGPRTPVRVNRYGPSFDGFFKYERSDLGAVRAGVSRQEFFPQRTELAVLVPNGTQSQAPQRTELRGFIDLSRSFGDDKAKGKLSIRPSVLYFRHDQRTQVVPDAYYDVAAQENRIGILTWNGEDTRFSFATEYAKAFEDALFFRDVSLLTGVQLEYDVAFDYRLAFCKADDTHAFGPSAYDEAKTNDDYVCIRGAPLLDEGVAVDKWGNRLSYNKTHLGNGDDINLGYFVQFVSRLPGDFGLTLGARVDYNPDYDPEITPRIAIVKPIGESFYAKALYASAFVYPPFLYRTGNRQAGIIGNSDIVPQSIKTFELLGGFRSANLRLELNGYYNIVTDFITFDDQRLANTREHVLSNRGDLYVIGAEASLTLVLLGGRLSTALSGATNRPLRQTSALFVVEKQLGGPSKYPPYSASLVVNVAPIDRLNANVSAVYAAPTKFRIGVGNQFRDIVGVDGEEYSSKAAQDYRTEYLVLNARASYRVSDPWEVSLSAFNVTNSQHRMAGATTVPYAIEGRQVLVGIGYRQ